MINDTVTCFINDFENKFHSVLHTPAPKHRNQHFYTEFSRIEDHMVKPKKKYSDWDVCFWLKLDGVTADDIQKINDFFRGYENFSNAGLFSLPGRGGDIEESLHYMAFMPSEHFAPFIDFHLKGKLNKNLWSVIYDTGNDGVKEHLEWATLTGWRKIRNGNIDGVTGARSTYKQQILPYTSNEADKEDEFIRHPNIYFSEKFRNEQNENLVAFLSN